MFPAFSDSRECKLLKVSRKDNLKRCRFLFKMPNNVEICVVLTAKSSVQKLLDAHEEQNSEAFTEAVS